MYRLCCTLLFLAIAFAGNKQAHAGQKLRVFFIGNSYTYTNDLPRMIADIAAPLGDTLVYEDHTPGGWKLKDHWNPPTDPCVAKIKTGNWDYVVLQEQSQQPAFSEWGFFITTYLYAQQFNKLIRDSAKCTTPVFYMTWGYKNGDSVNCPSFPHMCSYESMDSILRVRYLQLADSFDAVVSPVGAVRRYIRQNHPGIELYWPDESHPEVAGTYAAACCFYAALFKKDPSLTTFNSSVPAADALKIKAAAKTVVYDSLAKWGLGVYDLSAAYNHSISGNTVTFTNKSSVTAQTYSWDFGDGSASTLKDPVHTYTSRSVYPVKLITYDANGCNRVVSNKVNLLASGINAMDPVSFTITPNPVTQHIAVRSSQSSLRFKIRIASAMGQAVYQAPTYGNGAHKIDLSSFSNGMYKITVYDDKTECHHLKFMKQ
jgi:hypothetical protein